MKRFLTPFLICLFAFVGISKAQFQNIKLPSLNSTKESVQTLATTALKLTIDKNIVQVEPNGIYKRTVTIKNTSAKGVTFRLRPNQIYSMSPSQWKVTWDKPNYSVTPNGTVTATMTIKTNTARSVGSYYLEAVDDNSGSVVSDMALTFAVCSKIKYAFFTASPGANAYLYALNVITYNSMAVSDYATDIAAIPLIQDLIDLTVSDQMQVAMFSSTSFGIPNQDGSISLNIDANTTATVVQMANLVYGQGKNVIMINDHLNNDAIINGSSTSALVSEFLGNMQIEPLGASFITDSKLSKLYVTGIPTDTIGLAMNPAIMLNNVYHKSTFGLASGSAAKKCAYYDKADSGCVFRVENGSAKMVFSSADFVTGTMNNTRKFVDQCLRWFVGNKVVLKPQISANLSTLNFGPVYLGQFKDSTFTITSKGTDTLFISGLDYTIADDSSFAVLHFPEEGVKLGPGASKDFTVRFTPKKANQYTGITVNFLTNDQNNLNFPITFNGLGKKLMAQNPTLALSDTSIFFGYNSSLATNRELTFRNEGEQDLVVEDLYLTENKDNIFSIADPKGFTLKSDQSKIVQIRMPNLPNGEAKYYSAKLNIKSNDKTRPVISMLVSVNQYVGVDEEFNFDALSLNVGPNPVNTNATVTYSVDSKNAKNVRISIIDALGAEVALLVNGEVAPGTYSQSFDASSLSSGSYYLIAKTDNLTVRKAISIVK